MALLLCFRGLRMRALCIITSMYDVCSTGCFMAAARIYVPHIFRVNWYECEGSLSYPE